MRLRGLRFRKPWYVPPESFPFELRMTIPSDTTKVIHMLARDTLTWTFVGHPICGFDLTANRTVALKPGDELTVRGQVEGIDCRFMRNVHTNQEEA